MAPKAPINKLVVMIPLMLAARNIDSEDENIVFMVRCAYGTVQVILLTIVALIYQKVQAAKKDSTPIFLPPIVNPMAAMMGGDDAAPAKSGSKTYMSTTYGEKINKDMNALLSSTFMGLAMTCGLHYYKGMIMGLCMQSVMGPFTMYENPLLHKFLFNSTERVFDEKLKNELEKNAVIKVDDGNPLAALTGGGDDAAPAASAKAITNSGSSASKGGKKGKKNGNSNKNNNPVSKKEQAAFESKLLDTWDEGTKAKLSPLMTLMNEKNVNSSTSGAGWTPLMCMAGLKVDGTTSVMKEMFVMGADPSLTDGESWNALHWCCFHGSEEATKVLVSEEYYDVLSNEGGQLHLKKDKDGMTPLEHAKAEQNMGVVKILTAAIEACETSEEGVIEVGAGGEGADVSTVGLKQRKKKGGASKKE
jgi:hypothetical protein